MTMPTVLRPCLDNSTVYTTPELSSIERKKNRIWQNGRRFKESE